MRSSRLQFSSGVTECSSQCQALGKEALARLVQEGCVQIQMLMRQRRNQSSSQKAPKIRLRGV